MMGAVCEENQKLDEWHEHKCLIKWSLLAYGWLIDISGKTQDGWPTGGCDGVVETPVTLEAKSWVSKQNRSRSMVWLLVYTGMLKMTPRSSFSSKVRSSQLVKGSKKMKDALAAKPWISFHNIIIPTLVQFQQYTINTTLTICSESWEWTWTLGTLGTICSQLVKASEKMKDALAATSWLHFNNIISITLAQFPKYTTNATLAIVQWLLECTWDMGTLGTEPPRPARSS